MGIDILHLFPELAAIGHEQLQVYCDEWLQRPIAKQFAVAQITIDADRMLGINLESHAQSGEQILLPIDELLGYIVDRHFTDAEQRRELHAAVRDTRRRWGELDRDYEVTVGRVGTLWLTCKNPACGAEMETQHQAVEHQQVICPPTAVICPACGSTNKYEGGDLHWRPAG